MVPDRPYAAPTADQLLQHIQKGRAGLFALRARAKADLLGNSGRVKVDISLIAARPQRLRLAGENSLTGPLVTLATDGQTFQLLDVRENRFMSGGVSPCNMARILGVSMPPSQIIEVLMGGVPLLAETVKTEVSWDGRDGGREVLTMHDGRGYSEVIYLQAEGKTWDVREAEGRDVGGAAVWKLRNEGFTAETLPASGATLRLPATTFIEDPPHKSDVRLRWRERELNPTLEDGVFRLEQPPGVPTEPDVCAQPPSPPKLLTGPGAEATQP